ncbi:uncharacterized protein SETTUDRAFT_134704 [Exserohilum turcica Et28A]|uniref:Uncharacterized protein n=1 Tax=Exserohilum turcicum (strain 28A) TaxID=671987 RepID=R0K095_EXST2|nr:uncharacterized protein SETTUDRAFT_134704 [Exserohilum turcica Et28A]EOA86543.1 hypothetical protein SETTUDRAFT_134704 [Exserohilum turcica Et28A]
MAESKPGLYARLESSFQAAPNLRHSKHFPSRPDLLRDATSTPVPLDRPDVHSTHAGDDSDSTLCSQNSTPLASPGMRNGADTGLPPTPPTASQDGKSVDHVDPPPHADSVRNSLISHKSCLSTPVNARSPPTPDPSPPRTNASNTSNATLQRPPILTYPSSRATSYQTAREEPFFSDREESTCATPADERPNTVEEDRGRRLAFEQDKNDVTPTTPSRTAFPATADVDAAAKQAGADKDSPTMADIPDREWNTELMRNITIRKKRRPQSKSPKKTADPAVTVVETASPSPTTRARNAPSLRKRVEVGHSSPVTPSVENFAQSIGWPADSRRMSIDKQRDASSKRLSTSSVASTVVSAHVIVTTPQRMQTLRHSGRNMAYRRDVSSPAELGSDTHSSRNSMISQADSIPPHRLVHKRTSIVDRNRGSVGSDILASQRILSPSLSLRQKTIDSSAHTMAHQESVRHVLQPAADILSRHSAAARLGGSQHKRINSAPEPSRRTSRSSKPRNFTEILPPPSPSPRKTPFTEPPAPERVPSPTLSPKPRQPSPTSKKVRQLPPVIPDTKLPTGIENNLPDLPDQGVDGPAERDLFLGASHPPGEARVPSALLDRVRHLIGDAQATEESNVVAANPNPATTENLNKLPPPKEGSPIMRQGSRASRPGSWDPKRFSLHNDRSSVSPEMRSRSGLSDHEWKRYSANSGEHGRVSFDRSASRTEEHAMARHLYSQSTPFSQFSDTIEVTEATAVSIYPHNNHSLLVVQQLARGNSMLSEQRQLTGATLLTPQDPRLAQTVPSPAPIRQDSSSSSEEKPSQPTLTLEPSTPPMQIDLLATGSVDSPLLNPRDPPEPPKINFIPPTPMEELERPLAASPPGPPRRSDSHPQRRLSVLQRARRYSDNLMAPLWARKGNSRSQDSDSEKHTHRNPHVPTVNDEDGTLHPFWRPRGFWDEFSDSESDDEELDRLPQGGDTSDVEDPEPEPETPRRANTLKKLKGGLRGSRNSGGFLIGNSLGVERHGTNKRRHQVTLPSHFTRSPRGSSPKVIIQAPTQPLGRHGGGGITKRRSSPELRRTTSFPDNLSIEYEQSRRRGNSWRQGKRLPGLKKYHVQYIGISGVKEKLKERRTEKRREKIRRSIGQKYYVDPTTLDSPTLS